MNTYTMVIVDQMLSGSVFIQQDAKNSMDVERNWRQYLEAYYINDAREEIKEMYGFHEMSSADIDRSVNETIKEWCAGLILIAIVPLESDDVLGMYEEYDK